ncbi:unnamed protein product [Amoebophrya sp. A25]|nr:unnamed protein product [Amoebophrya sp. A25]|eukprot:GSA25T00006080001.1
MKTISIPMATSGLHTYMAMAATSRNDYSKTHYRIEANPCRGYCHIA